MTHKNIGFLPPKPREIKGFGHLKTQVIYHKKPSKHVGFLGAIWNRSEFVYVRTGGVFGNVFVDFGPSHVLVDANGQAGWMESWSKGGWSKGGLWPFFLCLFVCLFVCFVCFVLFCFVLFIVLFCLVACFVLFCFVLFWLVVFVGNRLVLFLFFYRRRFLFSRKSSAKVNYAPFSCNERAGSQADH